MLTVKYLREVTPYFRKASIISEVGWELQRGFLCGTPPRPHSPQRADTRYLPLQLCYLVRNFRHPDPDLHTGGYHVFRPPILVAIMSTDLHTGGYHVFRPPYWFYHVYRPPYWLLSCLQTFILVAIMSADLHTGSIIISQSIEREKYTAAFGLVPQRSISAPVAPPPLSSCFKTLSCLVENL
uniref:(California timema) hypothetical protein n=1 Tax=Timema californicum TaxID=61474 RepID=A0A7R9PAL6_TIMCA|nr:unnamed protein product [Timema californicum]